MRILVTGAGGQLGAYLLRELAATQHEVIAWRGRGDVDLTQHDRVTEALLAINPDAVIHAAAMSRPADAAANPQAAEMINTDATRNLALTCLDRCPFVHVSTDMVFDGEG